MCWRFAGAWRCPSSQIQAQHNTTNLLCCARTHAQARATSQMHQHMLNALSHSRRTACFADMHGMYSHLRNWCAGSNMRPANTCAVNVVLCTACRMSYTASSSSYTRTGLILRRGTDIQIHQGCHWQACLLWTCCNTPHRVDHCPPAH